MPTIVLLFMMVFSSLLGGQTGDGTPSMPKPDAGDSQRCISDEPVGSMPTFYEVGRDFIECVVVENVTATFTNTVPVQVDLNVSGRKWSEMDQYGYEFQVEQWRESGEIFVTIYRRIMPVNKTTPAPFTDTVSLDGSFEAGSYTVHVNNFTVEIAIPDAPPPGSDAPPPYPRDRSLRSEAVVQYVDVVVRDTYPARLTLHVTGYLPDGCALPLQIEQRRERYGNRVFVDIYRLVDPAMTCPAVLVPLDEYIWLDGTFERGTYTIQVNDYVTQVSIPFPPPPPPPPPPDPYRSYAVVENVEVLLGDKYMYPPSLTLHVTGYYSQGCLGQLQIEQYRQGYWVYVEIYQLVDPRVMCPEMLVRLDEYIPLDGVFEYGTYTIQVNDYTLQYTLPPVPIYDDLPPPVPYPSDAFQRYNAVIEGVDVTVLESYPMQLHVRVIGYQEGGCDPSFQMAQRRAGNYVTVEIFRLVNPLVMCDAKPTPIDETIPLEGGFESGEYTIQVNDYVVNITI